MAITSSAIALHIATDSIDHSKSLSVLYKVCYVWVLVHPSTWMLLLLLQGFSKGSPRGLDIVCCSVSRANGFLFLLKTDGTHRNWTLKWICVCAHVNCLQAAPPTLLCVIVKIWSNLLLLLYESRLTLAGYIDSLCTSNECTTLSGV